MAKENGERVAAPAKPREIELTAPWGYYATDGGPLLLWQAGRRVTDADEIADLQQRGAPHKVIA